MSTNKDVFNSGFSLPSLQEAYFYEDRDEIFINVPTYYPLELTYVLRHFAENEEGDGAHIVGKYFDKFRDIQVFSFQPGQDNWADVEALSLYNHPLGYELNWKDKSIWIDFCEKAYTHLRIPKHTERFIHVHRQ